MASQTGDSTRRLLLSPHKATSLLSIVGPPRNQRFIIGHVIFSMAFKKRLKYAVVMP